MNVNMKSMQAKSILLPNKERNQNTFQKYDRKIRNVRVSKLDNLFRMNKK